MMDVDLGQFPHCDQRVLHAPGECEYCDRHPQWQALRVAWGIAFTGHAPETPADTPWLAQLPCPADFNRPPVSDRDHRRWRGNVATTQRPVNEKAASLIFYGDLWNGEVVVEEVPVSSTTASPGALKKATWLSFRRRRPMRWVGTPISEKTTGIAGGIS